MHNHHYALGAALLIALAMPWTLAAAADLDAPIDLQAVQLQPQEQNGIGPLLYVQLPPGQYKVTGNAQGETRQQLVTVNGKAPATVNLNWR